MFILFFPSWHVFWIQLQYNTMNKTCYDLFWCFLFYLIEEENLMWYIFHNLWSLITHHWKGCLQEVSTSFWLPYLAKKPRLIRVKIAKVNFLHTSPTFKKVARRAILMLGCTMENSTNNFIFGTAKLEKFSIYNNVWGP